MRKAGSKMLALLLTCLMILSIGLPSNFCVSASAAVKDSNLITNPGFEEDDTGTGWTFSNGGVSGQNVHAGSRSGYLNGGRPGSPDTSGVSQTVAVPVTGSYILSGYFIGQRGASLSIQKDGQTVKQISLNSDSGYTQYKITDISLDRGDEVVVKISGGMGTVYFDDLSLARDNSNWVELHLSGNCGVKADDFSLTYDLDRVTPGTPSASSVSFSGVAFVGNTLTGTYSYASTQNYEEGKTSYRWLISDTSDGTFQAVDGAVGISYSPTSEQTGKYLKFEVTPQDIFGEKGEAVQSAASQVGLNITQNYGFESGSSSWAFSGASATTDKTALTPKTGSCQAVINPSDAGTNRIDQVVKIPQSGIYSLSVYEAEIDQTSGGSLGIRRVDGESVLEMDLPRISTYNHILVDNIALEEGDQIEIYANGGNGTTYLDDFELKYDPNKSSPVFNNIRSFTVENEIGSSRIDTNAHTVSFTMPYGTDVSALTPSVTASDGAAVSPSDGAQDFSSPVVYTVTGSNGSPQEWTVTCSTESKGIGIDSSNAEIKEAFQWAVNQALRQVQTGKTGILNEDERSTPTSVGTYIPSYWAGYSYRSAFYIRDYVHQAPGAHLIGLDKENISMLKAFLSTASASSAWYPAWALNFDGSIFKLDHSSDTSFVREVPSVFELVQSAYNQYRWTGNEDYITDPVLWNYYTKALSDFISLHDTKKVNGVAEGVGSGNDLNLGMASYNEQGNEKMIEAGDGIACEYAALDAYSKLLKVKGDTSSAADYEQKAEQLKNYFNSEWGVAAGVSNYVRGYSVDNQAFTDFGKENSWFMPLKGITAAGTKTTNYLQYIESQLETTQGLPTNMEACTYLPEVFFRYNQNELAWKWMKYIIENRGKQHQNASEGVNGNYPEISYTLVSQTVQGLMGITPDAPEGKVSTCSHLPSDIGWLSLSDIPFGGSTIDVRQEGTASTLTNHAETPVSWEAQYNGSYRYVTVNGARVAATQKTIDGVTVSFATVNVPAGGTAVAVAGNQSGSGSNHSSGPSIVPSGPASVSTFVSDTTRDFAVSGNYLIKITSKNGQAPVLCAGTPGVFEIQLVKSEGNDYYFKLIAIGSVGAKSGIYVNGVKVLVATVQSSSSPLRCDTTLPFRVGPGAEYCFKVTVTGGSAAVPSFTVGNGSLFTTRFVGKSGSDYFFKVKAIGEAGQSTGAYTAVPGQAPVRKCVISIGN